MLLSPPGTLLGTFAGTRGDEGHAPAKTDGGEFQ